MSAANLGGIPALSAASLQVIAKGQLTLAAGTATAALPYVKSTDIVIISPLNGVATANSAALGFAVANSGLANATLTINSFNALDTRVVNYAVIKT